MSEYRIKGETLTGIADAIRKKTGGTEPIPVPDMAAQIEGITSGGGGGSSADVCYVTFMNHDGTVELGKKAVAVGDDCADPIDRGVFDRPTRESDAQYDYVHIGWSKNPDNVLDDTALDAVTEDRVVYAVYAATVRYYTISYYDGDTLLKTESLAYGAIPSYVPTKDEYDFVAWEPAVSAVTGDASYTATWKEKATFATAPWEDIIAIAEAGNAASVFAVGDERTETITVAGVAETITWVIAGFGCSNLSGDFNGLQSNIDIVAKHALTTTRKIQTGTSYAETYNGSNLASWLESTFYNALPEALRNGIKTKGWSSYLKWHCWIPSIKEVGLSGADSAVTEDSYGSAFPLFSSNSRRIRTQGPSGSAVKYWLRDLYNSSGTYYNCAVATTGAYGSRGNQRNESNGVVPCFCL